LLQSFPRRLFLPSLGFRKLPPIAGPFVAASELFSRLLSCPTLVLPPTSSLKSRTRRYCGLSRYSSGVQALPFFSGSVLPTRMASLVPSCFLKLIFNSRLDPESSVPLTGLRPAHYVPGHELPNVSDSFRLSIHVPLFPLAFPFP